MTRRGFMATDTHTHFRDFSYNAVWTALHLQRRARSPACAWSCTAPSPVADAGDPANVPPADLQEPGTNSYCGTTWETEAWLLKEPYMVITIVLWQKPTHTRLQAPLGVWDPEPEAGWRSWQTPLHLPLLEACSFCLWPEPDGPPARLSSSPIHTSCFPLWAFLTVSLTWWCCAVLHSVMTQPFIYRIRKTYNTS